MSQASGSPGNVTLLLKLSKYLTLNFCAYLSADCPIGCERKVCRRHAGHALKGKGRGLPCSSTVPFLLAKMQLARELPGTT